MLRRLSEKTYKDFNEGLLDLVVFGITMYKEVDKEVKHIPISKFYTIE